MSFLKWLYPGLGIKRWVFLGVIGFTLIILGFFIVIGTNYLNQYKLIIYKFYEIFSRVSSLLFGLIVLVAGVILLVFSIRKTIRSIIAYLIPKNVDKLVEIIYQKQHLKKGPKIVAIGGGTGLSVLLRGLKEYTSNITAIVTVADDGGSSGILRGELGILPPGDIRNCLLALADTEPLMEKLFQYRFKTGSLKNHSFGNLFIAAMTEILGDFQQAVKEFSKVLAVKGRVLPATLDNAVLFAETVDGQIIHGESNVSKGVTPIRRVFMTPPDAKPLKEAIEAVEEADAIILGPGSLYTSIIPNLLIKELAVKIRRSPAYKIFITNVMTQRGETSNFTASDHVRTIMEYGGRDIIDCVIVNTETVPHSVLERYKHEGAEPVAPDIENIKALQKDVICGDFINREVVVRHDSAKLARRIIKLIVNKKYSSDKMKFLDTYFWEEKFKDFKEINN
jgi:uncharacterized cofD-like protein